jgi:hypothetical protein
MTDDIQRFVTRWQVSGAAERTNYQLFLPELCDVLDASRPDPMTPDELAAAFDAAPVARVSEWSAALAALGQARVGNDGRCVTA